MICDICKCDYDKTYIFSFPAHNFSLCTFCRINLMAYIKSGSRNIIWGAGRIIRGDWLLLKELLIKYEIKTVLEFGSGLSTELLSLENLDIVSMDILPVHIDLMKKAIPKVKFICYKPGLIPQIDNDKFDIVIVDGPAGDRSGELKYALRVAKKIIYCHDWKRGQDKVDMTGWKRIEGFHKMAFERST